ncbi:MAG: DUF3618 domain-containing protein [Gemmatimonadales bacterium]
MTHVPSPQEIEQEIEQTRERMSSNIDALEQKLSPRNLKRQAKVALAGKAQHVAANARDRARRAGARIADLVGEHLRPAAAIGLGAILLLALRARGRRRVARRSVGRRRVARRSAGRRVRRVA